jgi:Coenzyme PQQ synthesis protein D (PqqD)
MGQSIIHQKMEAARTLGRSLATDAERCIDSVYIGGSLTAGLGNDTSDADLFVLLGPGSAVDDHVTQYLIDGHRVDVERFRLDEAQAMVQNIVTFEVERDKLTALHRLGDDLDFVLRLNSSETVIASEAHSRLRARVTESTASIRRTAIDYSAITINGYIEDFLGAATEGDLNTAAVAAQGLVAYAGKAVAAASNDLYFSHKWVYKQLTRTVVQGFPLELFTRFQCGTWTGGGLAEAEEILRFTQTCVVVSHLLARADVTLSVWPSWTTGSVSKGLWRNPAFNVLSSKGGILLHWELHRQVVLKETAAFVWALCDGRSMDDVVADAKALATHVPSLRTLGRERVESIVTALQGRGLVATEPYSLCGSI